MEFEELNAPVYPRLDEILRSKFGVPWEKFPSGKWEVLVFYMVAVAGLNKMRLLYRELCGHEHKPLDKDICTREVRRYVRRLIDRGLLYRKKRYGVNHVYLTQEGKILAIKLFHNCDQG